MGIFFFIFHKVSTQDMSLQEILNHRRAIRHYDERKPLDEDVVRQCLELATLAPSSSNMQLWECYHITNCNVLRQLAHAQLNQLTATSAQQMVVFVTRRDKHREHAKAVKAFEMENVKRNSPKEKHEKRMKKWGVYYDFVMPLFYTRFLGLLGLFRKLLAQVIGLFHPIVRQVTEADSRVTVHKSCALAVQTFMLAMSEVGYDTCPVEGFDSKLVKRALYLPYHTEINMIITCGIRLPDGVWGDRFRLPFKDIYHKV